jgi:3-methyladenine DNA glycosylase AlkC
METPLLMKHQLGIDAITTISRALSSVLDGFNEEQFISDARDGIEVLELKQRVTHLIAVLHHHLPIDFTDAAHVLIEIADEWHDTNLTASWGTFTAWPLIDYVAVYGLEDPELSLQVLKKLTPLFSAEFAIRPFIEQHFELTHQTLLSWCLDDNEHVRRLASEGSRPRLPWGKQLPLFRADPNPILPILDLLKDDDSVYVRKSVANNLNDISKDNPDVVIELCQQWIKVASAERKWIIHHALRSLIKQGRAEVFPLLGYTETPEVELNQFYLDKPQVKLGEYIGLSLELHSQSNKSQKLVIDYKVHHLKANGSHTSKVFKWKNITLLAKGSAILSKSHPFKEITTRNYYPGTHAIELLVNGKSMAYLEFELLHN